MRQFLAYVVDREVLLAESDDPLSQGIGLWGGAWPLPGCEEELALRVEAKLMAENAETSGSVAETPGSFGRREMLDEVGSKSFVLPVGCVPGGEECLGNVR